MSKSMTDPLSAMTGANAELFKFWISFWPVAPAFGVEWRFAEMVPAAGAFGAMPPLSAFATEGSLAGVAAPTAKPAAAKPAPKARTAKSSAKPAPVAAATAKAEPAPATAPEDEAALPAAKADPVVVSFDRKEKAKGTATPDADAAAAPELDLGSLATPPRADPAPATETATAAGGKPATLFDTAPDDADDLQMIKGIGPGLESKLNALGIYKLDQIAGFSEADLNWIDENLTTFKGRCFRDDWVGQAKGLLA